MKGDPQSFEGRELLRHSEGRLADTVRVAHASW
jgi:hypothetical protein